MAFSLADVFEAVADAVPRRPALVSANDREPTALSYAELDERTNRLAHVLIERGVAPGDRVGVLLPNGARHIEALLGCLKAGAVPVNVNPRLVTSELRRLLEVSRVRLLLVHEPVASGPVADVASTLPLGIMTDDWETAVGSAAAGRPARAGPGEHEYVLYTGGTTGRPKGVLWRQHDLYAAALTSGDPQNPPPGSPAQAAERASVRAGSRCLVASSLAHGTGQWMALRTLLSGGTLIVRRDRHLRPDAVWETAAAERAAWLVVVGDAVARPLTDALASSRQLGEGWELGHLTVIASGGAPLSPVVVAELLQLLPTAIVVDGFGASETGGQGRRVIAAGAAPPPPSRFAMGPDSAVLGEDLRPLPPGDPRTGLLARTGRIPVGYDGDPEATAAAFPVVGGTRWALTGDRARLEADGTVLVLGRGANTINSGGEKVQPEEVEAALKGHPAVFDAVVVGVDDPRWGERVTAVVEPRPGCRPTVADLAGHCRGSMAAHKIPRGVVLVDEIVRHESGKPDYRWARRVAARASGTGGAAASPPAG